jgi:CubicO group peptidase (beta-lactamase class C family)
MKKFIKYLLLGLLGITAIFSAYALISGKTYLFKAVVYNFANIDDYKKFSNDTVQTSSVRPWPNAPGYNRDTLPDSLKAQLHVLQSVALLVVKQDSVLFEKYWDGYSDSSHSGSFSVAKSITSLLMGIAIQKGIIASENDPVGKYLPEFKDSLRGQLTIRHLLTMSSGSDWDESYANPLSVTTEAYYGSDLYKTATGVAIIKTPGSFHQYKSGDTQLLGLVLEKATGMSLAQFAAQNLWQPLGAQHPAFWSTDHEQGHTKAYCCFNSNARDFARIGKLMLDSGRVNGQALISPDYWKSSTTPCNIADGSGQACNYYGYQWWIMPQEQEIYYARGILGQYIICIPSKKMIVVRLGKMTSPLRERGVPSEVVEMVKWAKGLQAG